MNESPTYIAPLSRWQRFRAYGGVGSVAIGLLFFGATTAILMLRQDVVNYRPGQFLRHDITARVDFEFPDPDQLSHLRDLARSQEPRVYHPSVSDYWAAFADELLTLPDRTNGRQVADLPMDLRGAIDTRDLLSLTQYQGPLRSQYNQAHDHTFPRDTHQCRFRNLLGNGRTSARIADATAGAGRTNSRCAAPRDS
jgi:hypothetical protein